MDLLDGSGDDDDWNTFGDGDIGLEFAAQGEDDEREAVETMIEAYVSENADVEVSYLHAPERYVDRVQTQMGADNAPDVFFVPPEHAPSWDSEDVLLDLEGRLDDELIDDLNTEITDELLDDGMPYVPKDYQTIGVMYDESVFADAGYEEFPETWSEFRETLEAIDESGDVKYPYVTAEDGLFAADIWWASMFANGGSVMNEDNTECVIAADENVEVWEFVRDLREDELIGLGSEVSGDWMPEYLGEGETAMISGGAWVFSSLRDLYPDVEGGIDVAAPPYPDGEEYGNFIYGGGWGVSPDTDHEDESIELVEYLMGDEGMLIWLEAGIALPVRESLIDEVELYQEDDRYMTYLEMADHPRLGSYLFGPETNEILDAIYPRIEGLLHGEVEPREGLENVQREVNDDIL